MIKDYTKYKPAEVARFLKSELFYIEIDKLAAMQLRNDFEYIPDIMGDEIVSDLSKKEQVMATIYGLVKLYENGNTIRVCKTDDIINIYSLIYTHFRNIDNLSSGSIHPVRVNTDGLKILAMLAEEIFSNNKHSLNKHELDLLEQKMKIVKPLGMTDMSSVFREFDYIPTATNNNSGLSQKDVVLIEAQKELLY